MKVVKKVRLTMVDLDHILDIDRFIEDRGVPPSLIFLEGLVSELQLNGIDDSDVDMIEIVLE